LQVQSDFHLLYPAIFINFYHFWLIIIFITSHFYNFVINLAGYKVVDMHLIGRKSERETFDHCLGSSESKLIAVYGRRRVGKTFLIRKYLKKHMLFEIAGLYNGDMQEQLTHFTKSLNSQIDAYDIIGVPSTWIEAFTLLAKYIDSKRGKSKKVIFIDELPWFDTPRSKFLTAFESFWNAYCTKRNDLIVVMCGSAASWMIKKILKNKGGLHNRVSERIRLTPFNLKETKEFLIAKGIKWGLYDITRLYLITGGIPYYLDAVRKGESIVQFVDRCCFQKDGILSFEYEELFKSLFDNSKRHYQIVEALYEKKSGSTRSELIAKTKMPSGGTLSETLYELEESGFIESCIPYQGKKTKARYKLTDPFILFYLKFMHKGTKAKKWVNVINSASWKSWSGLAFERLCFYHIKQIQRALKIEAIENTISAWQTKEKERGAQIDLLIDRADRVINICEIKFYQAEFTITKDYAKKLRNKVSLFAALPVNKRKNHFLTLITPYGVYKNEYYYELIQNEVTLEDLFTE